MSKSNCLDIPERPNPIIKITASTLDEDGNVIVALGEFDPSKCKEGERYRYVVDYVKKTASLKLIEDAEENSTVIVG